MRIRHSLENNGSNDNDNNSSSRLGHFSTCIIYFPMVLCFLNRRGYDQKEKGWLLVEKQGWERERNTRTYGLQIRITNERRCMEKGCSGPIRVRVLHKTSYIGGLKPLLQTNFEIESFHDYPSHIMRGVNSCDWITLNIMIFLR